MLLKLIDFLIVFSFLFFVIIVDYFLLVSDAIRVMQIKASQKEVEEMLREHRCARNLRTFSIPIFSSFFCYFTKNVCGIRLMEIMPCQEHS